MALPALYTQARTPHMGGQQVAALPVDVTVLDSLPGARRLERDERVFAGCSALVALEESEVLLPARIVEVWDGAYVHVDYAAHGIGRLDEIVEAVRLAAVVQFVPGSPPKSAEPSPTKISEGTLDEQLGEKVLAQELDQPVQPDPAVAQQDDWKAYAEDFRKTRTGHLLDQKQQELQRLQMMLQHQKQCLEHAVRLQFTVDEDLLGLAVGAKGANLWSARQIEGVLSVDIDGNEVQVVAASDEAGQAARDVLEYLREAVPIQPHEGRLLIGRGGKNIRDLQTKCQLFSIKVAETHVDLVGSRKAVILAKRGIELVVRFMSHEESLAHDTQGLIKEVKAIPFGLLLENQNADGQDETLWREINNALAAPHARAGAGAKEEMPCFELTVPADKVGLIIGVKGAMIKEISEASRCRITVDKALDKALGGGSERSRSDMDARSGIDATLSTLIIQPLPAGVPLPGTGSEGNRDRLPAGDEKLAVKLINGCIDERARTIKQGLFPGAVLRVRVEKTVDFGAFVLLPNGKEGLLHISELDHEHVVAVTDYVHVGEAIHVVVLSVDERGRARLSLKDVDQESGVFLGQLPQIEYPQSLASFPGGGKGQHERLDVDDDRLFPSLESVSNFASTSQPPAATGAVASAVKTEEDSRAEWKARIRQQRDKAAHVQTQEEGDAKPKSYQHPSSQPPPRAFQQPQQQQHRQSMRGGIRAPEMQGKKTHNDSDYSRDIPLAGKAPQQAARPRPLPQASVSSRPSDRDGGEGEEGGGGMSLRSKMYSMSKVQGCGE